MACFDRMFIVFIVFIGICTAIPATHNSTNASKKQDPDVKYFGICSTGYFDLAQKRSISFDVDTHVQRSDSLNGLSELTCRNSPLCNDVSGLAYTASCSNQDFGWSSDSWWCTANFHWSNLTLESVELNCIADPYHIDCYAKNSCLLYYTPKIKASRLPIFLGAGAVFILLVAGIVFCCCRRRRPAPTTQTIIRPAPQPANYVAPNPTYPPQNNYYPQQANQYSQPAYPPPAPYPTQSPPYPPPYTAPHVPTYAPPPPPTAS